jgi:hypothetical protein
MKKLLLVIALLLLPEAAQAAIATVSVTPATIRQYDFDVRIKTIPRTTKEGHKPTRVTGHRYQITITSQKLDLKTCQVSLFLERGKDSYLVAVLERNSYGLKDNIIYCDVTFSPDYGDKAFIILSELREGASSYKLSIKEVAEFSARATKALYDMATPSGEPTYPKKLTAGQKQLLIQLGDPKWFTPGASGDPNEYEERRERDFVGLLDKIKTAGLPGLAKPADIEVSQCEIKNVAKHDVLIVLQHETGMDVAIRTHWLTAGQTIPNRSAANEWGRVWILSPKTKQDSEQRNEPDNQ